jgi:hypothetical protein
MVKETISLSGGLSIMRRRDADGDPILFSLKVRTFNRQSKKGGKLLFIKKAELLPLSSVKDFKAPTAEALAFVAGVKRSPNHFEQKTRNIKLPNGSIKKINLNYLISVNSIEIMY